MSWLSADAVASLRLNLAPKKSTLPQWEFAGAYFRSLVAKRSGVLEVAYHAMNVGQSISFEIPRGNACDAGTVPDTAERVYHGTSLAAASLIIRGGFISCALMEDSFVMFNLIVFLAFVFVFIPL